MLDAQKQANVKPSNNSRYGYLDLVQACIELKETRRESIAQWYSVTNTCSMKVKFFSAPDSPTYGSLKILSPGQTGTSWWNYVKKPKLPWVACPADAPNGNIVSVEGDANGPVACRYLL